MPLISKVGRKSPRARFALLVIYVLLVLGGLSMVYPFMLMAATGTKGPTDQNDNRVVPAFWSEDSELFRKYVDDKYSGKIDDAARYYGQADATKLMSPTQPDTPLVVVPLSAAERKRYEEFLLTLPTNQWEAGFRIGSGRISSRLTSRYVDFLRARYGTVEAINRAYTEQNLVFQTIIPPNERLANPAYKPTQDAKWRDWQEFKAKLPAEYRIPLTLDGLWMQYLRSKYKDQIGRVPAEVRHGANSFEEIRPAGNPGYADFLERGLPSKLVGDNASLRWAKLTGSTKLPQKEYDAALVAANAQSLRREYTGRNYAFVLDYVLLHGRAVWNTALFCILAVLTHLIVNPLAAYALSRFNLPATGKLLLFLLATMAFPAEITMIPGFLLLRDLGLLNTFAALVLPAAASGYSIYLLKGFFDSLPKDLYESAEIEGANEATKLFRVTLPMSKPVLAVIALTSFMAAYSAFMFAFLVAQDERMWTLMVWIYQLTSRAPKSVLMAALTLAAIPTLLVFLAAQRVILRGIILPGEK